jgi:hypothetical protein
MTTGVLEQRDLYNKGDYEYGGGKGLDTNGNGKKEIDCSTLVWKMLNGAGYNIPYHTTAILNGNVTHYEVVQWADVKAGDIAVWPSHTGFVESVDIPNGSGRFFGSQNSTGPASASFGTDSNFWPMAGRFLRVREQYKTGAQPAPASAPTPVPATPVTSPLMNFQYPIRKADGKQFTDAEDVYKAFENEKSGHYLLGSNKFWHGGIHISDASAPQCVLNEPVRCMADGEVVAYRLNQDYLESTFGDDEKKLKYSNSFCLVRHEYKSAPNPEDGPNKGKQNKLAFYSLYMHLLPYARYPLAPEETPKPVVTMNFGDYKGYDKAPWIPGAHSYGLIKKGTKLEILDQAVEGAKTYAKGKILAGSVKSGSTKTRNVGDEIWFAFKENDIPYQNSQHKAIWTADKVPQRLRPNYWQGKVKATAANKLDLYTAPAMLQNGQPIGARDGNKQLIPTSVVEFDSKEVLNLIVEGKLRRMAKCVMVSGGLAAAGSVPESFWTCIENSADYHMVDWTSLMPSSFDSVETASTGIKAGDPIGYLGKTENIVDELGATDSKLQVHVEIFTAETDVKDFLDNIAGLKIGRQYLHLPVGAQLQKKLPASGTSEPFKNEHAIDLGKAALIKEGNEDWYEVSVMEGGAPISGLVKKSDAKIITPHDWKKMGFQIVEESNSTADGFLDPDDMPQFFKDLFKKIDKDGDGQVEPSELAEALKSADTRGKWTKLVAHHPTEWKDDTKSEKWKRLDTLLESSKKLLAHERERIDEYVFWGKLSDKVPVGSGLIYHFHPIGFVSNFLAMEDDNDLKWLKVEKGQLTFDVEGNDLEDPANPLHQYFSRKVHWPGGASGITIGRGYDLGQRPNPQSDLSAVGIREPLLSWLIGAKGLSGTAARNYLNSASQEIKSTFITRKQQYKLFESVYEAKKNEVITISGGVYNVGTYGALNWGVINPKIQDMIVDLIYRGDYIPSTREKVQRPFVENNLAELKSVMSDQSNWSSVPQDRFVKRKNYL